MKIEKYLLDFYPEMKEVTLYGTSLFVELEDYTKVQTVMKTVNDKPGTYTDRTGRALVLAVGDQVEGIKVGDIIWHSLSDFQLFKGGKHPAEPKKDFIKNPDCVITTYKKIWNEDKDPRDCAEIQSHQVKAIESSDDFIFSDQVRKFYGE